MGNNTSTQNLLKEGTDLRESGKYRESIEILKQAESDPALTKDAYFEQAKTYVQMGKLHQAKACIKKAFAKDPDSADFSAIMGELLLMEGNNKDAISYLEKAAEKLPESIHIYQSLLKLYYETKNCEAEHDLFVKILPHFNNDNEFLYGYSICMLERSPKRDEHFVKESLDFLKKIQAAGFKDEKLEFFIAKAHFFLSEYAAFITSIGNFLSDRRLNSSSARRYGIFIMVDAKDASFIKGHVTELEKFGDKVVVKVIDAAAGEKKELIGAQIYKPNETVKL